MSDSRIYTTISKTKEILTNIWSGNDHLPVLLHSSPGVGKSDLVKQVASSLGYRVIDVRLAQMEASDVGGIPFVVDGVMKLSIPDWFPGPEEKVIIFFDELGNATKATQHAAYRLILDRAIHQNAQFGQHVHVVAATNLVTDKTGVTKMLPALANRFAIHLFLKANLNDFLAYAMEQGIDSRIIGFLNFRGDALYRFDPKSDDVAFPTPRSWFKLDTLLKHGLETPEVISGAIGTATANELMAFLQYEMPDFQAIMRGEMDYTVPEDADLGHHVAIASSIVHNMIENIEDHDKLARLDKVLRQLNIDMRYMAIKMIKLSHLGRKAFIHIRDAMPETYKEVINKAA